MATFQDAEDLLARWRQVERQLEEATPGSPDEDRLQAHVAALRDEYQRLVEEVSGEPGSAEPATTS